MTHLALCQYFKSINVNQNMLLDFDFNACPLRVCPIALFAVCLSFALLLCLCGGANAVVLDSSSSQNLRIENFLII